jgi:putative hydrolase of the HAD superfamily
MIDSRPQKQQTMSNTHITAVLFDWDLTLARVLGEVSEGERLSALFESQGLTYTLGEVQAAIIKYQNGRLRTGGQTGKPQTRQDIINSYFQILTHLGHSERDWELGNRLYDAHSYLPTFLYDDTRVVLQSLRQKGFSLGIVSNHARSARSMIERHVGDLIPSKHIIISQEVGVHKPAKTIFRLATASLGISPAHCMFVGDNLAVDAIGAVEQGHFGHALWLDRAETGPDRPLPDRVDRITSLHQIMEFLP